MNQISDVTRRNIFDYLEIEGSVYNGRLAEIEFLSRIFNLESLPSYDNRFVNAAGDIWQHRVNNPYDWADNWIFNDTRFNLLKCEDSVFLQFLCEMLHPIVRPDSIQATKMVQLFNDNLKDDGFEIVEKTRVANRPIFSGRRKITGQEIIKRKGSQLSQKLNAEYVTQQISLMESCIENAPHIAIGIAKELIETCCKQILIERSVEYDKSIDLIQLVKLTNKELKLSPDEVKDEKKAAKTIKTILGSLTTVVQGICELRNEYGSGHGKDAMFKGLNPRHAKLAVGAASTLAIFLLETHEIINPK